MPNGRQRGGFNPDRLSDLTRTVSVVPQIMGHTVFNYLLRDLDPTVITVAIMGEPVGASLLALAVFGEVPAWWTAVGGVLILAGIYLAVTAQASVSREVSVPVE